MLLELIRVRGLVYYKQSCQDPSFFHFNEFTRRGFGNLGIKRVLSDFFKEMAFERIFGPRLDQKAMKGNRKDIKGELYFAKAWRKKQEKEKDEQKYDKQEERDKEHTAAI